MAEKIKEIIHHSIFASRFLGVSIRVIIPAHNEANAIQKVIREIPTDIVREVIVVDNHSDDSTADAARLAGAIVLEEPRKGYGYACLKGMAYLEQLNDSTDIVVFMDGDHSDVPGELYQVALPVIEAGADMVIGSRALGKREKGSMTPQQVFGNWLATTLIRWLYGVKFTDLGPFRAIRHESLMRIGMRDKTYGWTVEMQVKAAKQKLKCREVPVSYRKRIGFSKVSGTVKGTLMAGYKILWTIFKNL